MSIWMVLLKISIGITVFAFMIATLIGIEWIFEKILNQIKKSSFNNLANTIFHFLGIIFVVLCFSMIGISLICFVYCFGDIIWKLI